MVFHSGACVSCWCVYCGWWGQGRRDIRGERDLSWHLPLDLEHMSESRRIQKSHILSRSLFLFPSLRFPLGAALSNQSCHSRNHFFHNGIKIAVLAELGLYSFQNPSPSPLNHLDFSGPRPLPSPTGPQAPQSWPDRSVVCTPPSCRSLSPLSASLSQALWPPLSSVPASDRGEDHLRAQNRALELPLKHSFVFF